MKMDFQTERSVDIIINMKINGKDDIRLQALDILSFDGIETLTMSELAKRVGLTKASLYHYYKSKDEILEDIFLKGHKKLMQHGFYQKLSGDSEANLRALATNWINLFRDDENYMYLRMVTSMHLTDSRAEEEYRALTLMLKGQASIVIQRIKGAEASLLSALFSSLLFSHLEGILEDESSDDEKLIEEICEFASLIEAD